MELSLLALNAPGHHTGCPTIRYRPTSLSCRVELPDAFYLVKERRLGCEGAKPLRMAPLK